MSGSGSRWTATSMKARGTVSNARQASAASSQAEDARTATTARATLWGSNTRIWLSPAASVMAHGCHAAIWYSCVNRPRTCFRQIRCSARLICGGRVPA